MNAKSSRGKSSADTEPIRILHLSDFHLREKTRWNAAPVLEGLADTLRQIVAKGLVPHAVAITGDVAFSGKAAEYEEARRWIDEGLLPAIRPRFPRKNLLIVPGNHDVDRQKVDIVAESLQTRLLGEPDQAVIAEILGDANKRGLLLNRHGDYIEFANGLRSAKQRQDTPWWSSTLRLGDRSVHFAGLCSSWMACGDEDYGRLLLGHWQVNAVLKGAVKADWSVALTHHPWPFVAPFDAQTAEAEIHHRCDLVLRGHLHRQQSRVIQYPNESCLELAAGAAYAGSDRPNGFQLIELLPDRQVRVHFWTWQGVKWIRDRNACPDVPDGTATFSLRIQDAPETAAVPLHVMDTSRYLRLLSERTSHIDIRGLLVSSGKAPTFPIDELYIPLTTTLRETTEKLHSRTKDPKAELHARGPARTELHEALKEQRLVIVGDPGSGKTTFLRRIAYLLCQAHLGEKPRAAQEKLGLDDRPFPLLIRLAALIEHIHAMRRRNEGPPGADAPAWLPHFLATIGSQEAVQLPEAFFQSKLTDGSAMVLLDGLDEAPSEQDRELLSALVQKAAEAFSGCRFVLTSRPTAYRRKAILRNFAEVKIEALEDDAIETFLHRWCHAVKRESPTEADRNLNELLTALHARPEIRRMAHTPVMLTALAVVHWNEKRLPEQRAELYESILYWLARQRPDQLAPERRVFLHQELALAMQAAPDGRRTRMPRYEAARALADHWRELPEDERTARAEAFLIDAELKSGIVVRRDEYVEFWHLTFQEYLAARALAARSEEKQQELLLAQPKLYEPEWRETVLLLAGVLYRQGVQRVDAMFSAALEQLADNASLAENARCFGLLGAAVQDLSPVNYQPGSPRYQAIADAVLGIFDLQRSGSLDVRVAIDAAEALGQAGDLRFAERNLQNNWVDIPAGEFWMGAQDGKSSDRNFDPNAYSDESPVHKVYLDAYRIGKYPVTVGEYRRFVEGGGYQDERYWAAGEFGQWEEPDEWGEQLQHLNRPVTRVSWYEASAYAAWAGCRLPTEAEWERAARGTEASKYPWGEEAANPALLNFDESNIECATPVGVYPRGATPDGIQDMAGNVFEWCQDWFSDAYSADDAENPTGPEDGKSRVLRGGCFNDVARNCRGAYRNWYVPSLRNYFVGFRLLCVRAARTQERKP